jgi:hypothetical protein
VIHSDKSGTTDLATMFSKIKAALEEQTVPEANQLVLSQALEPLVCPAADAKKMLKEGGEADDNGGEEPIETVGKMKSNAVEKEIETWIVGPGKDEPEAADLAAHDDTEDNIDIVPHDDCLDIQAANLSEAPVKKTMQQQMGDLPKEKFEIPCKPGRPLPVQGLEQRPLQAKGLACALQLSQQRGRRHQVGLQARN